MDQEPFLEPGLDMILPLHWEHHKLTPPLTFILAWLLHMHGCYTLLLFFFLFDLMVFTVSSYMQEAASE